MNHFPTVALRHSVSLRVPLSLYEWICAQAHAEDIPPATYTIKRLEELARVDLQKGGRDGGVRAHAG